MCNFRRSISKYYWIVSIFAKFGSHNWTVVNLHNLYLRIFIKRLYLDCEFLLRYSTFSYCEFFYNIFNKFHFWIWKKIIIISNLLSREDAMMELNFARMMSSKLPWNVTTLNIDLHQKWDLPLMSGTIEFHGSCRHVGDHRITDLCCRLNRRRRIWWRGLSIDKIQSCNSKALNRSRTLFLSRASLWKKKNWAE